MDARPDGQERDGFQPVFPGVYAEAQFGIPGVPYIRGDLSQVYYGGQLSLYSLNSTPPSLNGVDSFDIVKGPGSASSIFSDERANSWEFPILRKYRLPVPLPKPFVEVGVMPRA